MKGKFKFCAPTSVNVMGSYVLGTCVRPDISIDVALQLPAVSCLTLHSAHVGLRDWSLVTGRGGGVATTRGNHWSETFSISI